MSYYEFCQQMYAKRLADKKQRKQQRREIVKQIIERQNASKGVSLETIKNAAQGNKTSVNDNGNVIMLDVLPTDINTLKWMISHNIEMREKNPKRNKEAKKNISIIKKHISFIHYFLFS